MENLGLYDESQAENEEDDEEVDEYGNTSRSDPTAQADNNNNLDSEARAQQEAEEAKVEAFIQQEQDRELNQQSQ